MRIRALSISASILAMLMAAPALAQDQLPASESESAITVNWTVSVAGRRLFRDQGFTLTKDMTVQTEGVACRNNTCVSVWNSTSPSGNVADEETDIQISQTFKVDQVSVNVTGGYFLVPGKEVWDVVVDVSRPVSDHCTLGVRGELMRGGFIDTVGRAYGSCTIPVGESTSVTLTPSVAYSDWSGRAGTGLTGNIAYRFDNGVTMSLYGEGYANKSNDWMVGLRFSGTFGN